MGYYGAVVKYRIRTAEACCASVEGLYSTDMPEFWYMLAASILLVLFAGLMSGLTLGLLSLEDLDLRVIEMSGNDIERKRAFRVHSLLRDKHLLLVTLLLFNAAAMEALPLALNNIVPEVAAIVFSVTGVLFFGEIMPQAVCKVFGLAVGSAAAPLVKCLIVACMPLAWPIARLLDLVLGHDGGRSYRRSEMAAVLQIHREDGYLTQDEETVMHGALELVSKTCAVCMTPMDRVKALSDDAVLDEATLDWMMETGHSRVPIFTSDLRTLRGALLVKKLLRCKPEDAVPIARLELSLIMHVCDDTPLYKVLDLFQTGRSHMAAVYPKGSELGDFSAAPRDVQALGIVTLEDVIEELLTEEIVDETDTLVHAEDPKSTPAEDWRKGNAFQNQELLTKEIVGETHMLVNAEASTSSTIENWWRCYDLQRQEPLQEPLLSCVLGRPLNFRV
eukprot:CAMPEP_0117552242 /NCGR_PEP_ID=MMETSP0784-20121206/49605_1 /TAXON_ID=39447 /ORGANISM="" /LENGTH=446 /DNA_ID=CAMNT_0005349305 /DNA_START=38 /DNA_END=1378 /DNA_ORIENTATION=-